MIRTEAMQVAQQNDAELVAESLNGNQDAFRKIVERYLTLICSLAYCATGSVSHSEDLAQETFVAAWKELPDLREPSKLRSWLCAILRFRISKQSRRHTRDPVHAAESIETADQHVAPGAPPSDQAISNEEQAILWRSLERIPEMYREPLVLFYREHQSVEAVAQKLELSEDAVKQRLSRGRKLLRDEVLDFVTGALEHTNPGQAFTLAVLAALPAMTFSAKAAMVGAAAKGGAAAVKGVTFGSLFAMLLGPALGVVAAYCGWRGSRKNICTPRERQAMNRFARKICIAGLVFGLSIGAFFHFTSDQFYYRHPVSTMVLALGITVSWCVYIIAAGLRFGRTFTRLREEERRLHPELFQGKPVRWPIAGEVWEYRSRATLLGLPLVHCRFGNLPGQKTQPAVGWIAYGERAYGILFASGAISVGGISMGGLSFGILSFGGIAVGLAAFGGLALGGVAVGGGGVGWIATGGVALGWHAAIGGIAQAHDLALGGTLARHINDSAAREFYTRYHWLNITEPRSAILFWLLCFAPSFLQIMGWRWVQRKILKRVAPN